MVEQNGLTKPFTYFRTAASPTNIRLIQPIPQDPEPSVVSDEGHQVTYIRTQKRTNRFPLAEAVVVFVLFVLPVFAQAGFFAALAGIWAEDVVADHEPTLSANDQTVGLLKAAVHSDPNPSKGGGDILVDEDGAMVPGLGPIAVNNCDNQGTEGIYLYIVDEDDSLSKIAEMFCISTKTILWANDIKNANLIRPGDELVILPITGVSHVVKSGDTLKSIAKKYAGDVEDLNAFIDDIVAYNQLAGSELAVGTNLIIPGGEVAPPPTPKRSSSGSSSPSYASSGTVASGYYSHPLPGARKTQGIHGYNGVDLGAPVGTPIVAAAAGEVIVARSGGWNGGYGSYVVVKHANGTQTLYAHMSSVAVRVGDSVGAGQKLGGVGNTGRSTGAHLHFEVRGARNPF